jgi:hypothetical protein
MVQRLKHHPHARKVLIAGLGEDEDIIAVHLHKTLKHLWDGAKAGHDPAGGVER